MAAGKRSGLSGAGQGIRGTPPWAWRQHQWHRKPWWIFWRPAWRQRNPATWNTTHSWEYQTNKQRARAFLKENFSDGSPNAEQAHNYNSVGLVGKRAKI
jgi:hypothetical protein